MARRVLDLAGEVGVVERVAVGVEALVGRPRRLGQGAAARADREPRRLRRAGERGLGDLGRMGVARGLAPHGAQAEALGRVVARGPEPPVVEEQRLRPAPLEEELAVVGAGDRVAQPGERAWPRRGGLEGTEAGFGGGHASPGGAVDGTLVRRRRQMRRGRALSSPSADMVDGA
jgi:hypothetical protein